MRLLSEVSNDHLQHSKMLLREFMHVIFDVINAKQLGIIKLNEQFKFKYS